MSSIRHSLTYYSQTDIAELAIFEAFHLIDIMQLLDDLIGRGEILQTCRKYLFVVAPGVPLLDEPSAIIASRGMWLRDFPNSYLAIVSGDAKITATATISKRMTSRTESFLLKKDALQWLQQVRANEETWHDALGDLSMNHEHGIITIRLTQDIESRKLISMWEHYLINGAISKKCYRFLLNDNNFDLLDDAHRVLKSRGEWAELFPDAHLAIVSTSTKVAAVVSLMERENRKTRLFFDEESATTWLKSCAEPQHNESDFIETEELLKRLGALSYDARTKVATVSILRDIYLVELNQMWADFFNKNMLPNDTTKFILNQGEFGLLDDELDVIENSRKWMELFPQSYTALVTTHEKSLRISEQITRENDHNNYFRDILEAHDWLASLEEGDLATSNLTIDDASWIDLQFNAEENIAYARVKDHIYFERLNDFWLAQLRSGAIPNNVRGLILIQGTFAILDNYQDCLERKNAWMHLFPRAVLAVVVQDPKTIAYFSHARFKDSRASLLKTEEEALAWVNFARPLSLHRSSEQGVSLSEQREVFNIDHHIFKLQYNPQNKTAIVSIGRNVYMSELNQAMIHFFSISNRLQEIWKTVLDFGAYRLLDTTEELLNNNEKWTTIFPQNFTAFVFEQEEMIELITVLNNHTQITQGFQSRLEALAWLEKQRRKHTIEDVSFDESTGVARVEKKSDFTVQELNEMWIGFISDGLIPRNTNRFLIVNGDYQLTSEMSEFFESNEEWKELFPSAFIAIVTKQTKLKAIIATLDNHENHMRSFDDEASALEWLNAPESEAEEMKMAQLYFDEESRVATIEILRDLHISDLSQMWEEFANIDAIPAHTKRFLFLQNHHTIFDSAEILKNNKGRELFPDGYFAVLCTNSLSIEALREMEHCDSTIGVFTNAFEAYSWLGTKAPDAQSEMGKLFYDEASKIATIQILRDYKIQEFDSLLKHYRDSKAMPQGTKKLIINQTGFTINSTGAEIFKSETLWVEIFPGAFCAFIGSDSKSVAYATLVSQRNARVSMVSDMRSAISWVNQTSLID